MVVQHNMAAQNANGRLNITGTGMSKSIEKLSSGYRINKTADDAAGLCISEKMRFQARGLTKASTNAADGISLIQTAEGALNEVHDILARMKELSVQASNDTNTSLDRLQIQQEIDELTSEVDRIASTTQFNTMNLLDGSLSDANNEDDDGLNLQVGALSGQAVQISIGAMNATAIGINDLSMASFLDAGHANSQIDRAIWLVSEQRSELGAMQNNLEYTINNLDNTEENVETSESRIRDTDMAKEMVKYASLRIIQQTGQTVLAQANHSTQGVLKLLGG